MRIHITLPNDLVAELDRRVGPRRRSPFIAALVRRELEDERAPVEIDAAPGGAPDDGHEGAEDSAAWVRPQRRGNHPDARTAELARYAGMCDDLMTPEELQTLRRQG